jgi:ethanolamine ammonia-lyase large subunit
MIAAGAKLMSNLDLILGAAKIQNLAHCNTTIGKTGCLASRLQPNHPTDGVDGILASLREGLSYGVGDAVIGLNPVDDSMPATIRSLETLYQFVEEWKIPTQICVLAHISTQMKALRKGAPVDLLFQSIAGSQTGNEAFGVNKQILDEAYALGLKEGRATGPNIMYFETGQGSELSSEAHHGADQVTLEARCYGLARHYNPFLVNTVVGFIGPEYLYDTRQVTRAGLEDHFMGKLSGLPMGVDACYTNHMKADQNDIENLATLLAAAGCTYFMGIPMGDDVMLNYQTTSFHDIATLRELFNLRSIPEFEAWAESMGILANGKLTARAGDATIFTR